MEVDLPASRVPPGPDSVLEEQSVSPTTYSALAKAIDGGGDYEPDLLWLLPLYLRPRRL